MNSFLNSILPAFFAVGFLGGIRLMNSPRTAVRGNMLGAACMFGAILYTLITHGIVGHSLLWISIASGGIIGYSMAYKISMNQMPQLVALLNGLGGGASAITAFIVLAGDMGMVSGNAPISGLAIAVGGTTFSGSMLAAGKLDHRISQKPLFYRGHSLISLTVTLVIIFLIVLLYVSSGTRTVFLSVIILVCSILFGILMTLRIGGADMPVTISLLNAMSGLAASITGFAVENYLLVAAGAIVGSAGLILTRIMCSAMNRSLSAILLGKTTLIHTTEMFKSAEILPVEPEIQPSIEPQGKKDIFSQAVSHLRDSKTVIIVPGYGMALSQAQEPVKLLFDKLLMQGKDVRFAIHPVAGRMPGHMYVLLAEVDIPYDRLYQMEDINHKFSETDVVIVVGANDVINSAAKSAVNTPIYGMPVLNAGEAKHIIVCNIDTKPGYSGVENPLYKQAKTLLLLGDAKETITALTENM